MRKSSHRTETVTFGTGLPVVGSYKEEDGGNRLDNAGENLKLSFGAGLAIREFDYRAGDGWPRPITGCFG